MLGKKSKITITEEKPTCSSCIYSQLNEEYELICKGKKEVEPDSLCRRYKLDITKAANKRSHMSKQKQFDVNIFKL